MIIDQCIGDRGLKKVDLSLQLNLGCSESVKNKCNIIS